ncbi:MAG: hypothetical protein CNLJKLNK_01322 [Holosporales bacterium]
MKYLDADIIIEKLDDYLEEQRALLIAPLPFWY